MTSVRKRKMARSSVTKMTRRVKDKRRTVNIHSNPLIAANWDHSLTMAQNYKKLGLTVKLSRAAGGEEKALAVEVKNEAKRRAAMKDAVPPVPFGEADPSTIPAGEARIVRDDEGEVVKIIYGTMAVSSQGHNASKQDQDESTKTEVVKKLEELAATAYVKRERTQSERENDWCRSLHEKYGDDFDKMFWDKKLNVWQHSKGELRKKLTKWKKANGIN
ncbi:hypothetical protein BABINDRAFT_161412 [Babjeviella inositovora NRRL Y-12698]|uniref:Nucleolar protein 16 n=1 Tax=Babjeviella inositovora NRRL Y-12698 TaxID=984486 RepID=A0A1E3QPY1_9ASCO|nr:uncharacterized protein BABINDRAFT_161412 [Babjeviella inositovora NRRL Y-12698]ODQ79698.1 hypothetical protein BABINDRAFT_161412 [Babjeviella inositovora NRRL Y-12698]